MVKRLFEEGMNKVLLIDSTPIGQAPYLDLYAKIFDENLTKWMSFRWDKEDEPGTIELEHLGNMFVVHKKMNLYGMAKYRAFFEVSRLIKQVIIKENITHLVIVNSIWAILLFDCIHDCNIKFILDIRDYKKEKNIVVRNLLPLIIHRSYCTFISSGGFLDFLPSSEKIFQIHNIDKKMYTLDLNSNMNFMRQNPLRIGYVGYVRYDKFNRFLIQALGSCKEFELHYYGSISKYCTFHKDKALLTSNVYLHGPYKNEEKEEIYRKIDIINSLYDDSYAAKVLTPNRIYDAAYYRKPIIVNKESYSGVLAQKYNLGFLVDLNSENTKKLESDLLRNYSQFNVNEFLAGSEKFLADVVRQQNLAISKIKSFIK